MASLQTITTVCLYIREIFSQSTSLYHKLYCSSRRESPWIFILASNFFSAVQIEIAVEHYRAHNIFLKDYIKYLT